MNRVLFVVAALGVGLAFAAGPGTTEEREREPGAEGTPGAHGGDHAAASEATRAFMEAMEVMDQGMTAAPMTGKVDEDFVRMMIPHHQGAIDMAEVLLEHGEDPELRDLAKRIIQDQNAEIEEMKRWLEEHADTRGQTR